MKRYTNSGLFKEMDNQLITLPRRKVEVLRHNVHKYSVSAMCDVLQIPRSTYYYQAKEREDNDDTIIKLIVQIFQDCPRTS